MTLTTIAIAIGGIAVLVVAVDFLAGFLALLHDKEHTNEGGK